MSLVRHACDQAYHCLLAPDQPAPFSQQQSVVNSIRPDWPSTTSSVIAFAEESARGTSYTVFAQDLGKLLCHHRRRSRCADWSAIRRDDPQRRGPYTGRWLIGSCIWHTDDRPLLRRAPHRGDGK